MCPRAADETGPLLLPSAGSEWWDEDGDDVFQVCRTVDTTASGVSVSVYFGTRTCIPTLDEQ